MTEQSKPRTFLITDHTDNSGFSAVEVAYAVEHLACNVTHVVEKSYSDTLEQRIAVLEAGISKCRSNFHKEQSANAELSRKLAIAVEQRNQMTATFWANCDYLTATESEKRYDDQISELDEELNGDNELNK